MVLYAYIFAGVASLIAGAVLGWHTYKMGTFGYGRAVCVAILSTLAGTVPLGLITRGTNDIPFGAAIFLLPFAVASALICRWLMPKIGLLQPLHSTTLQITEK